MKVQPIVFKLFFSIALLGSVSLLFSCVTQECNTQQRGGSLTVSFRDIVAGTRPTERDSTLTLLTIYGKDQKDQENILEKDTLKAISLKLTLSPAKDTTTYVFKIDSAGTPVWHSLSLTYKRTPNFISQACGFDINYSDLAVLKENTTFDSAAVVKPTVNLPNEFLVKIYF